MQITVKPMGILRQRLGAPELTIELPEGSTLQQLLQELSLPHNLVQIIMVNGERESDLQRRLRLGDEVTLLAPVAGGNSHAETTSVTLAQTQSIIRSLYGNKDRERGLQGCFLWFLEEVGELAAAIRTGRPNEIAIELADVLAWLATLANVAQVDLGQVFYRKYGQQCPGCGQLPCACPAQLKP